MIRRLEKVVLGMFRGHAKNSSIVSFLTAKNKIVDPKDIKNLRQTIFNNAMFKLISKLQEKGYDIKWESEQERDKRFLLSLFFAHQSAIDLARKFSKVVVMDVTYRTNRHRLPFVSIVGTGNIGYPSLKTFCIAGGWVSQETNGNYEQVATQLRDIVWPSHQIVFPQTFVTDNEGALVQALDIVFPDSKKKLLCKVHMRRNFRTKLRRFFDVKDDYDSLKRLSTFDDSQYVDKFSNMCVVPYHVLENKAMNKYKKIATKS